MEVRSVRTGPSDNEDNERSESNTPSNSDISKLINLPDERTVLRDSVAVLRAFRQRDDNAFIELILQLEWEELVGILASLAGMVNTVFTLTAEKQGIPIEHIYEEILRGADDPEDDEDV